MKVAEYDYWFAVHILSARHTAIMLMKYVATSKVVATDRMVCRVGLRNMDINNIYVPAYIMYIAD